MSDVSQSDARYVKAIAPWSCCRWSSRQNLFSKVMLFGRRSHQRGLTPRLFIPGHSGTPRLPDRTSSPSSSFSITFDVFVLLISYLLPPFSRHPVHPFRPFRPHFLLTFTAQLLSDLSFFSFGFLSIQPSRRTLPKR